jgi:hypothetical protein
MINGTMPGTGVNIRELQATGLEKFASDRLTDNALREERGVATRSSYGGVTFAYNPASGSVPPVAFRMGAGGKGLVYTG